MGDSARGRSSFLQVTPLEVVVEKINDLSVFPNNEKSIIIQALTFAYDEIKGRFLTDAEGQENEQTLEALRSLEIRQHAIAHIMKFYRDHSQYDVNNIFKIIEQMDAILDAQIYIMEFVSSVEDALRGAGSYFKKDEEIKSSSDDVLKPTLVELVSPFDQKKLNNLRKRLDKNRLQKTIDTLNQWAVLWTSPDPMNQHPTMERLTYNVSLLQTALMHGLHVRTEKSRERNDRAIAATEKFNSIVLPHLQNKYHWTKSPERKEEYGESKLSPVNSQEDKTIAFMAAMLEPLTQSGFSARLSTRSRESIILLYEYISKPISDDFTLDIKLLHLSSLLKDHIDVLLDIAAEQEEKSPLPQSPIPLDLISLYRTFLQSMGTVCPHSEAKTSIPSSTDEPDFDSAFKPNNVIFIHATNEKAFLRELKIKLEKNCVTRDDILVFFDQIKNPKGIYEEIHKQKHRKWDWFRLLFKSRRNPGEGEKYFWHTDTYQKAVKLLKDAYLSKPPSAIPNSKADTFIDYVRGNSPYHPKKTSARDYLVKNPGKR